jgi:7,8-dihydropterin-6-yl-methyl-4-(beta-D-ribofuranosyl)aminobenzene 5'-phosphate synthase
VHAGERAHTLLFDAGVSPNGMADNMRRLGLDAADVEALVLSHGHWDHTGGISGLAGLRRRAGLPLTVHPLVWTQRRVTAPGREWELPTLSRRAIAAEGFEVVERRQPSLLLDGCVLITGEVDRTTDFETGLPMHEARGADGKWEPDPLILDDQALVVHLRGRGLVVLTGCGHAGAVNICRYAMRLTGVAHVTALLGGLHLSGPAFEPIIEPTVAALGELAPQVIVPAHCTGWRAEHRLAAALPDAFVPSAVGTRFDLVS